MASSTLAADVGVVSGNQLYERTVGDFRQGVANAPDWAELNSAGTELILIGRGKNQRGPRPAPQRSENSSISPS